MMYNQKMVASIKANGRILRENKDTVYIPFGSEYSFLIKNLNSTRALVNIFIDGENVVEGGLVINVGQEVDLERYVKAGSMSAGNKFKFIERTQAIEDGPRGIKLEDGLVRIEFQYEKHPLQDWFTMNRGINNSSTNIYAKSSEYNGVTDRFSVTASGATYASGQNVAQMNVNGSLRGVDYSKGESTIASASAAINSYCADNGIKSIADLHDGAATMDWMDAEMPRSMNDVGITVPGSKSNQKFTTVTMGVMEAEKHSIVLKLLGETPNNKPVTKPVTVDRKQKCDTCGKVNKAHAKFCVECGTALEIFA